MLAASVAQAAIPASERAVLDNLYASTHGEGWVENTGWGGPAGSECTWFGIDCSAVDGVDHITVIDLIDNHLSGPLPALAGLTHLRDFFAPINQLTGTIPPLNAMAELRNFDVFANSLDGSLPPLAGLSQLVGLDVSINQLGGGIPDLTGLAQLVNFDVSDNRLRGAVPALTGLTQLHFFRIGGNRLTGAVPDPPAPNNLAPGGSRLCTSLGLEANRLAPTPSSAWNIATGTSPWYLTCDTETIFADGYDD